MSTHADKLSCIPIVTPSGRQARYGAIVLAVVLTGLIALADHATGSELSCAPFYLLPVALVAWWSGFPASVLLALTGALLAGLTAALRGLHPFVLLCNGLVSFGLGVIAGSLIARLRRALAREQALARTDGLTGAANGRTFYSQAAQEALRAQRNGRPITLAYVDLDNFKAVNDRKGHAAGDQLLRRVAEVLRQQTRPGDLVARLGGDEFALLLPDADAAAGVLALARLRATLLQEMERSGWPVTFSIGAATFVQPVCDVDALVQHVDALMYRVKRGGKDRLLHEVVPAIGAGTEEVQSERRAGVRLLWERPARVRVGVARTDQDRFATVRHISAQGVELLLEERLPSQTLLTIEPLCGGQVKTLLARVLSALAEGHGWLHTCDLSHRLSEQELRAWVAEEEVVPQGEAPSEPAALCGENDDVACSWEG